MNRENIPLATDQPVEFEKEPVKVQDFNGWSPTIFEESKEHASNQ